MFSSDGLSKACLIREETGSKDTKKEVKEQYSIELPVRILLSGSQTLSDHAR